MSIATAPWMAAERFARRNVENILTGITDEEARRAPAPGLNTVNWVAGHILVYRDRIHRLLEVEPAWPEALGPDDEYRTGATGRQSDTAPSLMLIRQALNRSYGAVLDRLQKLDPSSLQAPATPKTTLAEQLFLYGAHDWYHIGQLAMLRRLLGIPAAVG